ncbi:MAG: hypothetical protein ACYDIC_16855 [Desulfobaccales bacterium]
MKPTLLMAVSLGQRNWGRKYGLVWVLLVMGIFSGWAGEAKAFSTNTTVDVAAAIDSAAQLTITPSAINFRDADPDVTRSIPANENPVSVTAYAQTTGNKTVTLSVIAAGDLVSGNDRILINNLTWTATGSGFSGGTMSKTSPQTAGSWRRSGTRIGTFSFFLGNSWSYATGNYSQTVTYTLTSP